MVNLRDARNGTIAAIVATGRCEGSIDEAMLTHFQASKTAIDGTVVYHATGVVEGEKGSGISGTYLMTVNHYEGRSPKGANLMVAVQGPSRAVCNSALGIFMTEANVKALLTSSGEYIRN